MGNQCCNMEDDETQDIDKQKKKPISAVTKESFMTEGTNSQMYMKGPKSLNTTSNLDISSNTWNNDTAMNGTHPHESDIL